MIIFGTNEKSKLAAVTGLAPMQVDKLLTLGLIDKKKALGVLISSDARALKRRGLYKTAQIKAVLAERYGVSVNYVHTCMAGVRKEKVYYCTECGKEIAWRTKKANRGKCNDCLNDDIKRELLEK